MGIESYRECWKGTSCFGGLRECWRGAPGVGGHMEEIGGAPCTLLREELMAGSRDGEMVHLTRCGAPSRRAPLPPSTILTLLSRWWGAVHTFLTGDAERWQLTHDNRADSISRTLQNCILMQVQRATTVSFAQTLPVAQDSRFQMLKICLRVGPELGWRLEEHTRKGKQS